MASPTDDRDYQLELARLDLDRGRFRHEIVKWVIIAVGAAVSFFVIDYGRLQLERFRVNADNERLLLDAYLDASETLEPDLWLRKLELIRTLSSDSGLSDWAGREVTYVQECAAKAVIYQETLRVAASLLDPHADADELVAARRRFEQLYWADLPYVGEGPEVEQKMMDFRKVLVAAETTSPALALPDLNAAMIKLGIALRDDDPKKNPSCGRGPPG